MPGGLFSGADRSDACGVEHAELADARDFFGRTVVESTVAGAALGAATGYLTALITGGSPTEAAALGAAGGAAAGGIAGYFLARQKQAADQQALASQIREDLQTEAENVDRATVTFLKVKNCRFQEAERIKADYRAGSITREEAQNRLQDQRTRFDQELALARSMGAQMAKRQQELTYAVDQLQEPPAPTSLPAPEPSTDQPRPAAPRTQGEQQLIVMAAESNAQERQAESNAQKRQAFETEVSGAEIASRTTFALPPTMPS